MATTFLNMTNRVLRKLNEVELEQSTFTSPGGIQQVAKDAVLDAIEEINSREFEWPFNAFQHTQVLGIAQEEYAWPANFKSADWESFNIVKDDSLGVGNTNLIFITTDQWYRFQRAIDEDTEAEGSGTPEFVFPAHGDGFGVTPSPNQNFTIQFRYFQHPTPMVAYNDTTSIPSRFDHVIFDRAMWYMYTWMDNPQIADTWEAKYQKDLRNMINLTIQSGDHVWDPRVNFGGGQNYWYSYGYLRLAK